MKVSQEHFVYGDRALTSGESRLLGSTEGLCDMDNFDYVPKSGIVMQQKAARAIGVLAMSTRRTRAGLVVYVSAFYPFETDDAHFIYMPPVSDSGS